MAKSTALVLFDIDGTLIRGAGRHHKDALVEGIRTVTGVTTTMEGIATAGTLDRDLITLMLKASGWSDPDILAAMPGIVQACHTSYGENCAADLRDCVCPGVVELLDELRGLHAALGVVSGNLTEIGQKKLELAGLWSYFSVAAFSQNGTVRAELAREAARSANTMQLIENGCPISLIGDHQNDVIAAKANGFQSVAVATGLSSLEELRLASPDILVRDLRELDPAVLTAGFSHI